MNFQTFVSFFRALPLEVFFVYQHNQLRIRLGQGLIDEHEQLGRPTGHRGRQQFQQGRAGGIPRPAGEPQAMGETHGKRNIDLHAGITP